MNFLPLVAHNPLKIPMNNSGIFVMCKEAVTNNVSVRPSASKEKEKERREQKGRKAGREKSVD